MPTDFPQSYRLTGVRKLTPTVKAFEFAHEFDFVPGQFIMVWVPGVDEIPISLSGPNQITVKKVGEATNALHSLKKGDYIGVRGPYGNGFSIPGHRVLLVGGGVGIAPMKALAQYGEKDFTSVIGAQDKTELFFRQYFPGLHMCTDDGSAGEKAFATVVAERLLKDRKFDAVAACGPEVMLKFLFQICEKANVPAYFSMERWMKCGIGVCGHCSVDPTGWRVCKEGPVADGTVLRNSEFFQYKRDQAGREVEL
ncbi:MAG: dihydroorotate dehydrogenase electron transfer subunit [Candidatus Diapherotrites archaeon]|nr:dihydroorotate dehydrogenase electron transfer subunit [Candidatus Diapherotrites archaeon]